VPRNAKVRKDETERIIVGQELVIIVRNIGVYVGEVWISCELIRPLNPTCGYKYQTTVTYNHDLHQVSTKGFKRRHFSLFLVP
jgi:hypothetical protein